MLVTGKKSKKTLSEKYAEEKARNSRLETIIKPQKEKTKKQAKKQIKKSKKSQEKKHFSWFKTFVLISVFISAVLFLTIYLLSIV